MRIVIDIEGDEVKVHRVMGQAPPPSDLLAQAASIGAESAGAALVPGAVTAFEVSGAETADAGPAAAGPPKAARPQRPRPGRRPMPPSSPPGSTSRRPRK